MSDLSRRAQAPSPPHPPTTDIDGAHLRRHHRDLNRRSDHTGWRTINDWASTMVEHIRIDPWAGRAPLVLTESRSLSGVLVKLARRYAVKLAATNGQCGGFLHTGVAPQLSPGDRVLYCGDWDWQGHQIEHNTRSVLERLIGGELDWKRIALTEEQVGRYGLQRAISGKASSATASTLANSFGTIAAASRIPRPKSAPSKGEGRKIC